MFTLNGVSPDVLMALSFVIVVKYYSSKMFMSSSLSASISTFFFWISDSSFSKYTLDLYTSYHPPISLLSYNLLRDGFPFLLKLKHFILVLLAPLLFIFFEFFLCWLLSREVSHGVFNKNIRLLLHSTYIVGKKLVTSLAESPLTLEHTENHIDLIISNL